ncbi:MAG: mechanosensitive ion channel family protein, partial [Thermodesulfobacteriota bacterium]
SLAILIVRKILLTAFGKWAASTETQVDDIILDSIRHPSFYWSIALALYVAVDTSPFPERILEHLLKAIYILLIFSTTIVFANLISKLTQYSIEKSDFPIQATGLTNTVIKGVILTVGALILLSSMDISITPFITALGVGGLAVALALQDTLSNLFAGVHIIVEQPIRVGDYIKLDSGEEGYVIDVGWRTTRIKMITNSVIIIPNNKLSQTTITNYYYPEKKMSLLIPIGVSYDSDPVEVERILIEETEAAVGDIPGLLKEPAPFVRFMPGFGDSSLDFTLICQIAKYVDQYRVQHDLRKRIFARFRREGIVIPFPIRTVYLKNGKQDSSSE